jgi:hypothetical protein
MAGATILVRIGCVLALNAATPQVRRRWRALFFTLTTITIMAGIVAGPAYARPLFDSGN